MAGVKKIPKKVKIQKGTLNKYNPEYIDDELEVKVIEFSPPPPESLSEEAKLIWLEMVPQFVSMQIFGNIDKVSFSLFCSEMGLVAKAKKELLKEGYVIPMGEKGYLAPNPWVAIHNRALVNACKLGGDFGWTPASRTRISVGASKPVGKRASIIQKANG